MTATDPVGATSRTIDDWLLEHGEGLIAFRRNIHAHPELSGEEFATTLLVAERLELAGLRPRILSGGLGLVCDLEAPTASAGVATPDTRLALRADLDALPMDDEKDVHYRSRVPGVMHACGHDVHTAVVLGTALYFAHHRDVLPGPVRFVFQPAEERVPGGALDVIADAGMDGVGAIVGLHCEPKLDVGTIGLKVGPISSAADMAGITLTGPGGHTARPELTVDLVSVASMIVRELPGRVAAHFDHPDPVKVVFGAIHAGDAANVIPTHGELRASVRTPLLTVWEELPRVVGEALADLLDGTGAEADLHYVHGVPPVVNDEQLTHIVRRAAVGEFGSDAITEVHQSWGGDDFAWFTRQVAGTYIRLGVHDPASTLPRLDLHAGHFDVDERAIAIGVRLMVATVEEYFGAALPAATE